MWILGMDFYKLARWSSKSMQIWNFEDSQVINDFLLLIVAEERIKLLNIEILSLHFLRKWGVDMNSLSCFFDTFFFLDLWFEIKDV